MPMDSRLQNRLTYFRHETAEFFFTSLMRHPYVRDCIHSPYWTTFCFDNTAQVICRKADLLVPLAISDHGSKIRELRSIVGYYLLKSRQTGRDARLFHVPQYVWNGTVLHPRDNMLVVVQRRPRMVWKVLNRDSTQPEIIARELEALRFFGGLVPPVYEFSFSLGLPYLKQEFALNTQPVSIADFPEVLRRLTASLVSGYVRAGINSIPVESWLASFRANMGAHVQGSCEFQNSVEALSIRVERHLAAILSERPGLTVYSSFAHGDITPRNIRRHKDQLKLIDWGNAGYRNILFDVFMADFTSGRNQESSDWHSAAYRRDVTAGAFRAWLEPYRRELHRVAGIALDRTEIAACVWISIGEKLGEIARRYSGRDEKGVQSLRRIAELVPRE
jgi:hypothetical protein